MGSCGRRMEECLGGIGDRVGRENCGGGGLGLNEQERRDVSIGDIAFFLIYDFYRVCFFWKVLEELIFSVFIEDIFWWGWDLEMEIEELDGRGFRRGRGGCECAGRRVVAVGLEGEGL